jgi:hypothetical protein
MPNLDISFKLACGPGMFSRIRGILSDRGLPYGAKILAFTVLDSPLTPNPSNALLARKMHTSTSQVSVWRGILEERGYKLRPETTIDPVISAPPQIVVDAPTAS